jgi:hypothetical protein
MDATSKHVVCMKLPHLQGIASHRKDSMVDHGKLHKFHH